MIVNSGGASDAESPPPRKLSFDSSSASSSSIDMDDLPPRSSLRRLLNPVTSSFKNDDSVRFQDQQLEGRRDSLIPKVELENQASVARNIDCQKEEAAFSSHPSGTTASGSMIMQSMPDTSVLEVHRSTLDTASLSLSSPPAKTELVWMEYNNSTGVQSTRGSWHPASPLKRGNRTSSGQTPISPSRKRTAAPENYSWGINTFHQYENLPESDRRKCTTELKLSEDVSSSCRTYLLRVEDNGNGDALYTRWQTSETSAFLEWILGPDTKVPWDELGRGDQSLYFEQAAQELFGGQRSKSSIRNKWDRMMNTYQYMVAFAEFSGIFGETSLPNHGQLKKLLHHARRKGKMVGPLTTHVVQQWYLEGWFRLWYSRFGKTGRMLVGKPPNDTAKSGPYEDTLIKPSNSPTSKTSRLVLVDDTHQDSLLPSETDAKLPTFLQNATHDSVESKSGGQASSSHLQSQDYNRDKLLLALELVQVDDEDIRNAARERLIAEWRKNENMDHGDRPKLSQEDKRLRLKIARVLLRAGDSGVKEESKKFLMSELG